MGRNADQLKVALKNVASKDVDGSTKGEILENFNLQYEDVELTINVVDSVGEPVATPTVVLKKGATIGSGDTVTASAGKYPVLYGTYNYSITKTGYVTKTGLITIGYDEARAGVATSTIALVAS
jgi:hypothetical protein